MNASNTRTKHRKLLPWFVVVGLLAFIGGVGVLLVSGPVSVPLLGVILAHQGSRGPVTLDIGSASLDFTAPDGIRMVVSEASIKIDGDAPVSIELPSLEAPIERSALFAGNIRFSSLRLDQPKIGVELKGNASTVPEVGPLMEAFDRMADLVDDQFARRGLTEVAIRNARFEITGPSPRVFDRIDVNVFRERNRTIRADAKVSGGISAWRLDLLRTAAEQDTEKKLAVVVNGITLAELLGPDTREVTGKGLRLPASAKFETVLDSDGNFVSSNVVARVSNGWFQMGKTFVAFDDAAVSLLFSSGTDRIEITPSHVYRGNTRIFFTGFLDPPVTGEDSWKISLDSEHPLFGSADVPELPHRLEGIAIRGRFSEAQKLLNVDRFTVRSGMAVAHGVASVQFTTQGPYLAIAVDAEKVPVAVAKQIWPITMVPPARKWVIERLTAGLIEKASFTGALQPPAFDHRDPAAGWSGDDLALSMTFSDAAVLPVGDVPVTSGLSGTLAIENEILTVNAEAGTAKVSGGGEVAATSTVFRILDLNLRDGKIAEIRTQLEGSNADLANVMNSDPFRVVERAGLEQGGLSGSGWVDIEARFPLEKDIDLAEIEWKATGGSQDFSDANPILGHTIANADVIFEADKDQIAVLGKGVLDGLQADINLVVPLGDSDVSARQDVVVSVTAEQLRDRGVDLTAFLNGTMKLGVAGVPDGQEFTIDLLEAEVSLKALGWVKAKNVPATASFKLVEKDGERRIQDFSLIADGADIFGQVRLTQAGELISASFKRFQLRPGDEAELDIEKAQNGRYDIIFNGASFDGRGLIRSLRNPGGSQGEGDFENGARISVALGRVTGFNNNWIANVSGKIDTGPKGLMAADVDGLINGSHDFSFKLTERDGVQLADGQFADTGATLAFLDLYERMKGGQGALEVVLADEDSWVGEFRVRTLMIAEDPAIKRIRERNARRRGEDEEVTNTLRKVDGSARFDTLDISFTRDGEVMTISRGALRGASLGGTVSGTVDLVEQTLNMTGTFVPIYALNNFFAKIPLLGFALGGSSGEGLIGVTYRLSGSLSDPVLTVNPISAIAPGIFRKMFEFQPN